MENEQCDGREAEVCPGVSGTGMEHERTVRAIRDRTGNRVCVVEAISGHGMGRAKGEEPSGRKISQPDSRKNRRGDSEVAAKAHELGAAETEASAGTR